MKNFLRNILRQQNTGRQIGNFFLIIGQLGTVVSLITLLLAAIAAYIPIQGFLLGHNLYLKFWQFILLIITILVITYILTWKFLMPSFYNSFNKQFYAHNNPIKKDLSKISRDIKEISNRLSRLEQNGDKP